MEEPTKYLLKNPITNGSELITMLTFRPPKAKDLRLLPIDATAMTMGHIYDIGGRLCGQPPHIIDDLEGEDALAVLELINGFLGSGRATGPMPSGS